MRKNGKDSVHNIFACVGVCLPYLSEASSMTLVALKSESESEVAQLCPTLCNPMDSTLPHSSVHGIFQARVLEWGTISFSRGSSWSRDWTRVSCTAGRCFTIRATREESSKYFFPMGKGENVILLGYPLFLHRTAANLFTYGDILLACVWTVFQAASFAKLAPCTLAGPGAAPTRQVSCCLQCCMVVTARQALAPQPLSVPHVSGLFWLQNHSHKDYSHKCHFHGWGKQEILES